jgi:SOS response associated peptidase (SRAP)
MLRDVTVSCRLAQLSAVVWQPTNRQLRTMCGRVIQSGGPIRYAIVDGIDLHDSRVHNYPPLWNAAPSQELLVIRRNHQTGEVSLDPLRWGLIPYGCQDPKGGRKPINAKCETVDRLPMFRDAYRRRRCIVPVDGFFEWKAIKGQKAKQPFAIAMKDGKPFGIGGLWENWKDPTSGEWIRTFRGYYDRGQRNAGANPQSDAVDRRAERLRSLAERPARSARFAAAIPGGAHADVAYLDPGQQAGERRSICCGANRFNRFCGLVDCAAWTRDAQHRS